MSIAPKDPWTPISAEQWDALRAAWPDGDRLRIAWDLARDVDTLADLLAGRDVDPARLNQAALDRARSRKLVRLETRPVDLFRIEEAE